MLQKSSIEEAVVCAIDLQSLHLIDKSLPPKLVSEKAINLPLLCKSTLRILDGEDATATAKTVSIDGQ